MARPDGCLYTLYEETYLAMFLALGGDAATDLRAVVEAVEELAGRPALVASKAALDAFSHAPMRSMIDVCGSKLARPCAGCALGQ